MPEYARIIQLGVDAIIGDEVRRGGSRDEVGEKLKKEIKRKFPELNIGTSDKKDRFLGRKIEVFKWEKIDTAFVDTKKFKEVIINHNKLPEEACYYRVVNKADLQQYIQERKLGGKDRRTYWGKDIIRVLGMLGGGGGSFHQFIGPDGEVHFTGGNMYEYLVVVRKDNVEEWVKNGEDSKQFYVNGVAEFHDNSIVEIYKITQSERDEFVLEKAVVK